MYIYFLKMYNMFINIFLMWHGIFSDNIDMEIFYEFYISMEIEWNLIYLLQYCVLSNRYVSLTDILSHVRQE